MRGSGARGLLGVLLHLLPHPAQLGLRGPLHHPVHLLEQVERPPSGRLLAADEIGQLVDQGLGEPRLPGERHRVDLVGEPPAQLPLGDVETRLLAVQAAVRVEHDAARCAVPPRMGLTHVVEEQVQLGRRRPEPSRRGEPPVVAEVDDVVGEPVQVGPGRVHEPAPRECEHLAPGAFGDDRRDAGSCHPRVVPRLEPVVVGQGREALGPPLGPPRVLHEEADVVVADEAERVSADRLRRAGPGDDVHPLLLALHRPRHQHRVAPAVVDRGGDDDGGELVDGGLEVVEAQRVDPVESAQRTLPGQRRQRAVVVDVRLGAHLEARPVLVGQQTVVVPAHQGAAQRGADVRVALVVVIPPGQGVEHVGADVGRVALAGQDGVGHRGDGVPGARAPRLCHHEPVGGPALQLVGQRLQARAVVEVAGVEHIGHRVRLERAVPQHHRARGHRPGHGLTSAGGSSRAASTPR